MTITGKFKVDVYDCEVYIVVSDKIKQSINTYLRLNNEGRLDYDVDGYCWRPQTRIGKYYVFFDLKTFNINCFNHEKSHLVEFILEDRSIKAKDEMRSYLDGFISTKMNAFFKKRKIKIL